MSRSLQKILCVEDDADIRTIAKLALEAVGGIDVELAASGEDALRLAGEVHPDLLLLDVMMPGMDGPATLRALHAMPETAELPAIFLTARTQAGEVAALRALGAVGVITKPFDPMTLADQIRDIWETLDA
ncbi:MAG: response regulator [Candidatus Accumulibacter sp.]|uniref:response regulator n=1 Tax=Accumulibacter sp. TaxID=2053492 RepID=UPI0025F5F753|nr:response regulator [Accumulibacter sp.]MCP5249581.1 response regulator [Accumulibacter sp.]